MPNIDEIKQLLLQGFSAFEAIVVRPNSAFTKVERERKFVFPVLVTYAAYLVAYALFYTYKPADFPAEAAQAGLEKIPVMQAAQVDDGVKKILSELHGSLMLDLIAFSPWTRNQKVLIYIFDNRNSYAAITGRPEWTGGTSSLSLRTVYVINDDDMVSVLAHELTHIYFDSFFSAQNPSPLWLSEGMPDPDMVVSLSDQLPQQTDRKWIARLFDGDIRNN